MLRERVFDRRRGDPPYQGQVALLRRLQRRAHRPQTEPERRAFCRACRCALKALTLDRARYSAQIQAIVRRAS